MFCLFHQLDDDTNVFILMRISVRRYQFVINLVRDLVKRKNKIDLLLIQRKFPFTEFYDLYNKGRGKVYVAETRFQK